MNGQGIEQSMRPTFKTYALITGISSTGVITSSWQHGQTDSDIFKMTDAAMRLADADYVTGQTAWDSYTERHGAYRWTCAGESVHVTVWAVREYK